MEGGESGGEERGRFGPTRLLCVAGVHTASPPNLQHGLWTASGTCLHVAQGRGDVRDKLCLFFPLEYPH